MFMLNGKGKQIAHLENIFLLCFVISWNSQGLARGWALLDRWQQLTRQRLMGNSHFPFDNSQDALVCFPSRIESSFSTTVFLASQPSRSYLRTANICCSFVIIWIRLVPAKTGLNIHSPRRTG